MRTDTVFFSGFNRNIVYLVGLNAQDNFNVIDLGKQDDIWFHVTDLPSCHVVAQVADEENLSKKELHTIIKRGAFLCKQHSAHSHVPKLQICYTKLVNVQKSSPVGTVITTNLKYISI
jgi:predicted ribosome quality control (RQC) complex YloA/Tae2 family protein